MSDIDWKMDAEIIGIAALVAADAAAFLSAFCPSFFTMRMFRSEDDPVKAKATAEDIRIGSAIGSVLAVVVGIGGTLVAKSWWPLFAAIFALGLIITSYEYALRNPHNLYNSIADQ